jgi:hypothetical protein
VWVPQPEFEGQTKTRLGNPEVRRVVESVIGEQVSEHLEFYPNTLGSIFSKASQAQKAAEAAKRARELVRRKSVLRSGSLPGKLSDCSSSDPESTEIFLVEGDSAGGSAKQGRDRRFQAVLPLRGKILNVERKDDASMYKNTEITAMVTALGLGLKGDEFDESALRYSKIVILTDADVDGAHIRTLLLTFLFRYQRGLFERGKIFVAVPPLYKVESGRAGKNNKPTYCYDESQLQAHLATLPEGASKSIQRFKGLGEMMPVQLWNTTLNPETRLLKRLTVDDAAMANKTFQLLDVGQSGAQDGSSSRRRGPSSRISTCETVGTDACNTISHASLRCSRENRVSRALELAKATAELAKLGCRARAGDCRRRCLPVEASCLWCRSGCSTSPPRASVRGQVGWVEEDAEAAGGSRNGRPSRAPPPPPLLPPPPPPLPPLLPLSCSGHRSFRRVRCPPPFHPQRSPERQPSGGRSGFTLRNLTTLYSYRSVLLVAQCQDVLPSP